MQARVTRLLLITSSRSPSRFAIAARLRQCTSELGQACSSGAPSFLSGIRDNLLSHVPTFSLVRNCVSIERARREGASSDPRPQRRTSEAKRAWRVRWKLQLPIEFARKVQCRLHLREPVSAVASPTRIWSSYFPRITFFVSGFRTV